MLAKLKLFTIKLVPRIHNLPQIIYIKWFDYEWFIKK